MSGAYTLITGASSGIGAAIAQRFIGRPLILSARSIASDKHLAWPFDLTNVEQISGSLAAFLQEHDATVDTFVHCAGIVRVLPMRDMDAATAAEMMNVNCLSAAQIVRTLLRRAVNRGALQRVLFLSSVYAIRGAKGQAVYSATKGALDAMMRSLAVELAPNVRVNSIVAGGVPTPMSRGVFENPELLEKSRQDYPLRLGEVSDVVDAAEFLLSEKASWITGTSLVVDGGMSIR